MRPPAAAVVVASLARAEQGRAGKQASNIGNISIRRRVHCKYVLSTTTNRTNAMQTAAAVVLLCLFSFLLLPDAASVVTEPAPPSSPPSSWHLLGKNDPIPVAAVDDPASAASANKGAALSSDGTVLAVLGFSSSSTAATAVPSGGGEDADEVDGATTPEEAVVVQVYRLVRTAEDDDVVVVGAEQEELPPLQRRQRSFRWEAAQTFRLSSLLPDDVSSNNNDDATTTATNASATATSGGGGISLSPDGTMLAVTFFYAQRQQQLQQRIAILNVATDSGGGGGISLLDDDTTGDTDCPAAAATSAIVQFELSNDLLVVSASTRYDGDCGGAAAAAGEDGDGSASSGYGRHVAIYSRRLRTGGIRSGDSVSWTRLAKLDGDRFALDPTRYDTGATNSNYRIARLAVTAVGQGGTSGAASPASVYAYDVFVDGTTAQIGNSIALKEGGSSAALGSVVSLAISRTPSSVLVLAGYATTASTGAAEHNNSHPAEEIVVQIYTYRRTIRDPRGDWQLQHRLILPGRVAGDYGAGPGVAVSITSGAERLFVASPDEYDPAYRRVRVYDYNGGRYELHSSLSGGVGIETSATGSVLAITTSCATEFRRGNGAARSVSVFLDHSPFCSASSVDATDSSLSTALLQRDLCRQQGSLVALDEPECNVLVNRNGEITSCTWVAAPSTTHAPTRPSSSSPPKSDLPVMAPLASTDAPTSSALPTTAPLEDAVIASDRLWITIFAMAVFISCCCWLITRSKKHGAE